jgi:hypothetical protein
MPIPFVVVIAFGAWLKILLLLSVGSLIIPVVERITLYTALVKMEGNTLQGFGHAYCSLETLVDDL